MKIVHAKPLPRRFAGHPHAKGLLAEADIRVTRAGRLFVKLLVFDKVTDFTSFWQHALGVKLGRCVGAVSAMSREVHVRAGRVRRYGTLPARVAPEYTAHIECDPRYVCVMGLCSRWLSMEIVTHESVHAGFAYAKRRQGDFWTDARAFDEENVAYPTGRIARAVNKFLHDEELYR